MENMYIPEAQLTGYRLVQSDLSIASLFNLVETCAVLQRSLGFKKENIFRTTSLDKSSKEGPGETSSSSEQDLPEIIETLLTIIVLITYFYFYEMLAITK